MNDRLMIDFCKNLVIYHSLQVAYIQSVEKCFSVRNDRMTDFFRKTDVTYAKCTKEYIDLFTDLSTKFLFYQ